jgi:hypothetical protein
MTLLESGFKSSPDSFKQQMRDSIIRQQNANSYSILFRADHSYSLKGEEGRWQVHNKTLIITALKQRGKRVDSAKHRLTFQVNATGTSFGRKFGDLVRLDFNRA